MRGGLLLRTLERLSTVAAADRRGGATRTENGRYWARRLRGAWSGGGRRSALARLHYNPRSLLPAEGAPERGEEELRMHYPAQRAQRVHLLGHRHVARCATASGIARPELVAGRRHPRRLPRPRRVRALQPTADANPFRRSASATTLPARQGGAARAVFGTRPALATSSSSCVAWPSKPGEAQAGMIGRSEQALEDYMAKSFAADHQKDYGRTPHCAGRVGYVPDALSTCTATRPTRQVLSTRRVDRLRQNRRLSGAA